MTENVTGYLTSLAYGAATGSSLPAFGSDSYTPVLDLETLKIPAGSRQVEERYVLDKKAAKKFIGSLTFAAASGAMLRDFDSSAQNQMEDDANSGVPVRRNFRAILPNSGNQTHYWIGYCSKFEYGEANNQGVFTVNYEIEVDGEVTIVR